MACYRLLWDLDVSPAPARLLPAYRRCMTWWRRRTEVFDIVTPTERERLDADIARRRRAYLSVMIPCLLLVAFGFLVPAPTPIRVGALVVAAVLPPVAAIVGNARPR